MIPLRRCFPSALATLGLLAAGTVLAGTVLADAPAARAEDGGRVLRIAERCDVYGSNFVDLGNGVCGQVVGSGRIRVDNGGWPAPGTSNAALRSGSLAGEQGEAGLGMVRGASGAQHLRIGADPQPR